jgi:hypothetical protein
MSNVCGMFPFFSNDVPDQFYRLFTSLYLHAGIMHLAFTIAFQHIFLSHLERLLGPLRTAIIYIASGIAGNLTSSIFVPYRPEVSFAGFASLIFDGSLMVSFTGRSTGIPRWSHFITSYNSNFLSLEAAEKALLGADKVVVDSSMSLWNEYSAVAAEFRWSNRGYHLWNGIDSCFGSIR